MQEDEILFQVIIEYAIPDESTAQLSNYDEP